MFYLLIFILLIILIIFIIIRADNKIYKNDTVLPISFFKDFNTSISRYNLQKYVTKNYIMTYTELLFFRKLKKVTDNLDLLVFPQVDLERIIQVSDNNLADRNRIKSRSIDYTIVSSKDCKIICCIELDDKSHNTEKAKQIDEFKNELFKKVNIPLHRIKVNNYYDLEQIENLLKEKEKENV